MVPALQILCMYANTSQDVQEYACALYPLCAQAAVLVRFLHRCCATHRRIQKRLQHALGVYNATHTSDNIFLPGDAEVLSITTTGLKLKAGDIEVMGPLQGTSASPLHLALVLEDATQTDGDPEVIDMNGHGVISIKLLSEFGRRSARFDIVRLPLANDTTDARQRTVDFARYMHKRYETNPELFPKYHPLWWNCDSFVCACLTQGVCTVSGQTLALFAKSAQKLAAVAATFLETIPTWSSGSYV